MAFPSERNNANVTSFDFRRVDRLSGRDIERMRASHEAFAKLLSMQFSEYLGVSTLVELSDVSGCTWDEVWRMFGPSTCLLLLELSPGQTQAALQLDAGMVSTLLESVLGGKPDAPLQLLRDLTAIEVQLLDPAFQIILRQLNTAWSSSEASVGFTLRSAEARPPLKAAIPDTEVVALAEFQIQIEAHSALLRLAIPAAFVRSLRQDSDPQATFAPTSRDPQTESRILDRLGKGTVRTEIVLSGTTIAVEDVLGLEQGDILKLDLPLDAPLSLRVNGVTKFAGSVSPFEDRRAFTVLGLS